MSNIMNDLHTLGINPFGVVLVAESLLKSPVAEISVDKPLTFFFPIERADCAGFVGVEITLKAVKKPGPAEPPCTCLTSQLGPDYCERHAV